MTEDARVLQSLPQRATSAEPRPRTRSEMVGLIEIEWRRFRDRVGDLGPGRLSDQTSAGWSYKDMVGHVVAWLEFLPTRLRELRADRPDPFTWSDAAADRFNAESVEQRRLTRAEDVLAALDAAYAEVLKEASRTTDDEIARSSHASGVLSLIAWCTYLHFREHYKELGVLAG